MAKNKNSKKPKQQKFPQDVEFGQELGQQQSGEANLSQTNKKHKK